MNYELQISQSLPYSLTPLNGDRPPLVAGSGSATLLTASSTLTFPAFQAGRRHEPFSLEVWFLPVSYSGVETTVIGHTDEGVMWNGTTFTLRVRTAGGVAEATWTPLELKNFYVVMTYDTVKAALWIDGQRVAQVDIPAGEFTAVTNTNIVLNHRVGGTATGIYDSAALYVRTLSEREIQLHYTWGRDVPESWDIASSKGATTYTLTYDDVDTLGSFTFDVTNFGDSFVEGLSVSDDRLEADSATGGVWMGTFPLGPVAGDTTAGVHLTYEGQGVALSYSLDGITWTATPNKRTVLEDATVTDKQLFCRIQLANDTSWVRFLRADVLATRTMQPFSGSRVLSFRGAAMDQTPGHQLEYHDDLGATLVSGGFVEMAADTSETPVNVRVIEFWYRKTSNSDQFILDDGATVTVRINGQVASWSNCTVKINGVQGVWGSATVPLYTWNHFQVILASDSNRAIRFGAAKSGANPGEGSFYGLSAYSSDRGNTYSFQVGAPAIRVDDTGGVTLSEDATAASVFAYSWSYVSGGR